MQNDPIEPKATQSTLFFLFPFIHLLCLSHVARPLEAMISITEMPKLLLEKMSPRNWKHLLFQSTQLLLEKMSPRNWKHLLFQSTHFQLTFVLVTIAGAILTLVLHSPHPWQVVDNCKTSMVELILQLLVHCLSSPCIFPTTHKWQELAAHPGCHTHRPHKVLLETLSLTHKQ
jgi:hypothetical protein